MSPAGSQPRATSSRDATTDRTRNDATDAHSAPATNTSGRTSGPFKGEDPRKLVEYYRLMLLIRRFEEKAAEMYQRAKIGGYCHLNLGEEATCVGLIEGMRPTDYLFTNYREHGYALARGMDAGRVMAELFGRESGVSNGRGGSMHLFDNEARLLGGYAIVGGQLPLATGAGLAAVRQGKDDVVVCQMGDATTNIGAFHESLNIAALWKLPVVFVIINNGYGMGTTVDRGSAVKELYKKACAYGIPGEQIDGNDVLAVREGTRLAVERARKERIPSLLDIKSFRLKGHSVVDPDRYRSEEIQRDIRANDPVPAFASALRQAGVLSEQDLERIAEEIDEQVQAAVDFADASPEPDPARLFQYSYATPVENQPFALPGEQPWR